MKFVWIFAVGLCMSAVLASPVDKRAIVTEDYTVTVIYTTITVPGPQAAAATEDSSQQRHGFGGHHWHDHDQGSSQAPPALPSTATPSSASSSMFTSTSVSDSSTASSATTTEATTSATTPLPSSSLESADRALGSEWSKSMLDAHNWHRDNHSAELLTWAEDLANSAQQIAESCVYAHSKAGGDGDYGQNIGAGAPFDECPQLVNNRMYNDEMELYPEYGVDNPDMTHFEQWGHFSQMVWRDTKEVGCAAVLCPNGLANTGPRVSPYFMVCNFRPAGNFEGMYGQNVLAPKGQAMIII